MRAIDPIAYLRSIPPFDGVALPLFEEAARGVEVAFHAAGAILVRAGGEPLRHLYVIRRGSVRLEREGQTLQVLEEGEAFGYTSLITKKATLDVMVEEDLLAYRLPDAQFQRLLSDAGFARHFAVGLAERLKASLSQSPVATFQADLSQDVGQLVRRSAVWIDADATVGQAARAMRNERISSLLVRTDPPGIVTDRDFRARVLAEGRGPGIPVTDVLSRPLRTVSAGTPVFEAWKALLEAGVHHLAVERDGAIVGVLTSTDLLKCSAQGPVSVLRSVERLSGRESLPGFGRRVAEMTSALLAGGLEANTIAGFVGRLGDALLRRILAWAEADLGPVPVPYAWLEFGTAGRMEQTLLTDQDNALAYADEGAARRDWFQAFAERVNGDLETAGYPRCLGGRMARRWHATLSEWIAQFTECIDERPHDAAVFFDLRKVGGDLDVAPLEAALARAPQQRLFLRRLAKAALQSTPPAGFLLRDSSNIDLKSQGISAVVHLARCYAIEVGSAARNTLDRLDAAREAGLMGDAVHADVTEAYRYLLGLRLRAQLRLLAAHEPLTSDVHVADLSALERNRLKDSLRAIRRWQEKAAYHYQAGLL
jgi:CBS domain-containing protein